MKCSPRSPQLQKARAQQRRPNAAKNQSINKNNFKKALGIFQLKKKKNPPANAGDTGSSPGPGRSHMPRNN